MHIQVCFLHAANATLHQRLGVAVFWQVEKLFLASGWQPVQLESGEAATRQLGSQFEYGPKLDPSSGSPQDIDYLHLFVTATPVRNGI